MATTKQQRTDLNIEEFRKLLDNEKAVAEAAVAGVKSLDGAGMNQTGTNPSELSDHDENHPADAGTELQMREQDDALIRNAQEILSQINRAFEKIDEGTYGLSDRSQQPIPKERLEVLPYATLTADEQETMETT